MLEQIRPSHAREDASPSLGNFFDGDEPDRGTVTVASGLYTEQLPVANSTVGEIRSRFRDRLDIDPQSAAVLDGHDADERSTVRPGQVLMFVRRAGEKGYAGVWSALRALP